MKKGFLRKILAVVVAIVFASQPSNFAFAKISESQLNMFSQNNILLYDPTGGGTNCAPATISGNNVSIIGDSISVGAQSQYESQIPGVDLSPKTYNGVTYNVIEVSKHFAANAGSNYGGMTIADVLQQQGELKPFVVFALGTNDPGGVTDAVIDQLMDLVGTNHKVVLTTNYAPNNYLDYSVNNAAIRSAGERYSNVAVADWAEVAAENQASYFSGNDVHPTAAGSEAFVKVIKEALNTLAGGTNGVSTGGNVNYAGVQVWTDSEMQLIEANAAVYQEAAERYGFQWQVIAVVHSLESSLARTNPGNYVGGTYSQGLYGFYNETNGGEKPSIVDSEFGTMTMAIGHENTEAEFLAQTLLAARTLSQTMENNGWSFDNPDDLKRLFVSYNGVAEVYQQKGVSMGYASASDDAYIKAAEGSAYVMNRYDEARDPTSSGMSAYWPGRYVKDGVYDPNSTTSGFGAFVKYEAIAGSSYCVSGGGSIVETAINISWEGSRIHDKNDPKPEYVAALQEVGLYETTPCNATGCAPKGASCDFFVSTVMRYSGSDPDFPGWGPGVQMEYMANSNKYEEVDVSSRDASVLQPGDIFVVSGGGASHIFIHLGDINGDGQMWQASASFNDRTGEHYSYTPYWTQDNGVYRVFRRIN